MPDGGTPLAQVAAQFQHDAARKFRDLLNTSQFGSIAEFARNTPEISYERLRAILTGDMWMRMEDIALLSQQLKVRPVVEFGAQTFEKNEKE